MPYVFLHTDNPFTGTMASMMRKFKGSSDFLTNASPDAPGSRGIAQRGTADGVGDSEGDVAMDQGQTVDGNAVLQILDELGNGATPSVLAAKLGTDAGHIEELLARLKRDRLVEEEGRSDGGETNFSISSIGQRLIRYRKKAHF